MSKSLIIYLSKIILKGNQSQSSNEDDENITLVTFEFARLVNLHLQACIYSKLKYDPLKCSKFVFNEMQL